MELCPGMWTRLLTTVNTGLKIRNTNKDAKHKLLRCYRTKCNIHVLSCQNNLVYVQLDVLTPDRKLRFFCPHSVYKTYFPFSQPSYCCLFAFCCSLSTVVLKVLSLQLQPYNAQVQPAAEFLRLQLTCAVTSHSLPHLLWFDILWTATWLHTPACFFILLQLLETTGLI
jgi:hypothetical protein